LRGLQTKIEKGVSLSTNFQAPAFAEAASRRQAKFQIISKFQFRMTTPPHPSPLEGEGKGEGALNFGNWNLFGIWILGFGILIIYAH
jgi:hypothetical protein